MNLFERIQYKLNEEPNKSDSKGQNKKSSLNNKKFSDNISNKVDLSKTAQKPKRVTNRMAKTIAGQDIEKTTGDKFVGGTNLENTGKKRRRKLSDTTKGGPVKVTKTKVVKQSEVSKQAKDFTKKINKKRTGGFEDVTGEGKVKYPKTRKELIAKRKEYGIDRKGNISDAGVKRYAQKTKQLSSGSNLPVTPTQKELEIAKKRAVGGTPIKNKDGKVIGTTTGKYGGKLSRKRPSNAPSLAQIKAKIDAKNPTYKRPISGGELPLNNTRSPVDTFLNKIKKASKQDPEGLKKAVNKFPDFPERKLPRTVLTKTKASKAFPLGLKPVDTKTKEGEKIARRVTKKFVTDKELMTGFPPETKPPKSPKSPKSPKPSLFTRAKKALKGFHKFMVKDAGFRKTSGSGRLMKDTLGGIARDVNKTRHIYKNTIRGNTFRLLNKALPGHYKTLAAAGLIAYGLSNRGKKKDEGKGNNVATPKNPYAGKKFKNVTGTLKLGDGNKK